MTEIAISHHAQQRCAVIAEVVPMVAMKDFFDRAFATVAAVLQEQGVGIVGPPFARYRGRPTDMINVACGFPTASSIVPTADVVADVLPSARVYEAVHTGPYEGLPGIYDAILERILVDGAVPSQTVWEYYLTDRSREADPTRWITRVCWPVVEAASG